MAAKFLLDFENIEEFEDNSPRAKELPDECTYGVDAGSSGNPLFRYWNGEVEGYTDATEVIEVVERLLGIG